MPRVSIITPTYNHAGYIAECIESVLAQTFADWEMLIVDDGSTDGTSDVVAHYDDARIRSFRKPNGGIMRLADGYNLALREARGDLVAILEGDDYWPPDKLALQVPEFDAPEVVLVTGFAQIVDDGKNDLGRIPNEPLPEAVRLNRPVGAVTRMMMLPTSLNFTFPVATILRKSALDRIGGFRQPDDLPLVDYPTFLAIGLEGEFRFVPKPCGFWRRHPASTTKSRFPQILDGCYRESTRLARAERERIGLTDEELNGQELAWESFQAKRLDLLAQLLSGEGRRKDARRALSLASRFRRSSRQAFFSNVALRVASLGLPIEWVFRLNSRRPLRYDLRERVSPNGNPFVEASDIDHDWPIYRRETVR